MTESEWDRCRDPGLMMESVRDKATPRKLRLFACACARQVATLEPHRRWEFLEIAERFADGVADPVEVRRAVWAAAPPGPPPGYLHMQASDEDLGIAMLFYDNVNELMSWWIGMANFAVTGEDKADILRELFGNPFRNCVLRPSWLSWREKVVPRIAASLYKDRNDKDFPVLADALEEAGCDEQDLLGHCRGGHRHVHGCWLLDLILAKK